VKFTGKKLNDLLSNPILDVNAILLYGPDRGLVREYSQNISTKCTSNTNDPFSVTNFTGPQLKQDPSILIDAVYSMSLAGGDCVIIIRDAQDNIVPSLAHIFSQTAQAWPIIIEASILTPKSALRKMFEQSANLAAIGCYPDDGYVLEVFIKKVLSQEGLSIDQGACEFLCTYLAGDRQIVRRELEKLILYCLTKQSDTNQVTEADAIKCVGDSSETSMDSLIYSVGDGNQANIDKMLAKMFSEGINPVVVIRSIQRHFQRLHFIHSQRAKGESLDQALGKLRPPVFFKRKDNFERQVYNWSADNINRALLIATKNEIDSKTTGLPAEILCNRALMRIAQTLRRS
jgi:DNA polymerase-3 subunit delta